jgi:hypothetical protein
VAGAERLEVAAASATVVSDVVAIESTGTLRPIQDFLRTEPPPPPVAIETGDEGYPDFDETADELPPVEHFLDPLPPVSEFSQEDWHPLAEHEHPAAPGAGVSQGDAAEGWVQTDWQQYDWRSAAALGETGEADASNAWATTDWEAGGPRAKDARPTAAQAIASALDQIAQRIRDGELVVPGQGSALDPTNIAATLAALLGVKR